MDNKEIEKRFSTYLKKILKGYSNKQKLEYLREINTNSELSDKQINKLSYQNYLQNNIDEIDNIDVDINHLENIFHNERYFEAMKKVPLKQRQVLYLLVVKQYNLSDVAEIFKTTTSNISKLKRKAINNFKKNLENKNG
jgi:sigma-70, region 4